MILADSSVWIEHLRAPQRELVVAISESRLLLHPFVIAELALGSIRDRAAFLEGLFGLPQATKVDDDALLHFVESYRLFATGLGMVDAHLLASVAETPDTRLWTRDRQLHAQADRLGLAFTPA